MVSCQCEMLEKKFDCKKIFHHEYAFTSLASKDVKTVLMSPKEFLLTTYREVSNNLLKEKTPSWIPYDEYIRSVLQKPSVESIKKVMVLKKKQLPIPFLHFDENGEPIGHEGRHTAAAAEELGIKAIPVTIEKPKGVPTRRFAGMEFEEYCEQYGKH